MQPGKVVFLHTTLKNIEGRGIGKKVAAKISHLG